MARDPLVPRAGVVSFPENINVEVDADVHRRRGGRRRRWRRWWRRRRRRRGMRGLERHGARAPQHHEAAGEADDAAQLRRARRLRHRERWSTSAPTNIARCASASSIASGWRRRIRTPRCPIPVKPIVFYIDPATPAKWVPFVKKGVESWQPAFEAAGFRNAIQAKDAPKNDPEWSAGRRALLGRPLGADARPKRSRTIHDPRSGEILSASVDVYPNVQTFGPTWYFVAGRPARQARAAAAAARRSASASCCASRSRTRSATRSACRTT